MAGRTFNLKIDGINMKSALLLFPNLLGDHRYHEPFLPTSIDKAVGTIDGLIAESESAGRRFLGRFNTKKPPNEIPIAVYNIHTKDEDLDFLLEPILKGERWGFVSDSGLPCIADPGSKLVRRARQQGVNIQAFVGPSSIMLGLMLSGLPGQQFSFHGYLEKEPVQRLKQIKNLESISKKEKMTQIFIEAPYRNKHVLESLLNGLSDQTLLCVAWELTMPEQGVVCQPIFQWKKCTPPNLEKKNAIFLFNASFG